MKHRFENGRRYHSYRQGENEYWGPNDEVQNDQLDIAHHMFLILLGQKLHLAPIRDPQRILDLGCGTGIWCIDMAEGTSNLFSLRFQHHITSLKRKRQYN
jgi:cyclopropane fatty-acyl-phospholipid synthase-like methyltransferase